MNKSRKDKKGNIWKFLGEHWYLVANIVIVSLIIILTIVFFLEKPKKKNTQSKNTANSCQNNTEKYITGVVVSTGKNCPDGYYNVDITGKKNIMASGVENTYSKLCYTQPDRICKGDLIVTNLNTSTVKSQPPYTRTDKPVDDNCQSPQCKKSGYNTKCQYTFLNNSSPDKIDMKTLPPLECRCRSCGDVPVGHYDVVLDSNNKDTGNVIYNNKCAGDIPNMPFTQMCMSQDEYGTNNTGISDIIYSDTKVDGYTNVDRTNIFFK